MSGLSLGACLSNLKSVALTVLELLAFNAAANRHTERHTSNENSISAIHSVHLAEIMNKEDEVMQTTLRTNDLESKGQRKNLQSDGNIQSFLHGLEPNPAVFEVRAHLWIIVPTVLYTATYGLLAFGHSKIRTISRHVIATEFHSVHNLCQVHNSLFQ